MKYSVKILPTLIDFFLNWLNKFKKIIVSSKKKVPFLKKLILLKMELSEIRAIIKNQYLGGNSVSKTPRNINSVFGSV